MTKDVIVRVHYVHEKEDRETGDSGLFEIYDIRVGNSHFDNEDMSPSFYSAFVDEIVKLEEISCRNCGI
jgi:hypothetical protein